MKGKVSAIALIASNEATTHFLLMDNMNGNLFLVSGVDDGADLISYEKLTLNLFDVFSRKCKVNVTKRFYPVSIFGGGGETRDLFIVDAGTGEMALLKNIRNKDQMQFVMAETNLYSFLMSDNAGSRKLSLSPWVTGRGTCGGMLLFDNISDQVFFIENPHLPDKTRLFPLNY